MTYQTYDGFAVFLLLYMIVNLTHLAFGLLVGKNKPFEDVILCSENF